MVERSKRGALYEDVLAAPEHLVAEIIRGDLYLSPRPAPRHSNASSSLGADLHDAFQRARRGPGGWWILDEPELHLGPDVLVPDIAGWKRDRMPELPQTAWFPLAPDWLCEVISPSTENLDRGEKLAIYSENGVAYIWIVDPSLKMLEVLRRDRDIWRIVATHVGNATVCEPPFETVSVDLAPLWA